MKKNISTLFAFSTLLFVSSGCLDDENLGLRDYPLNQPSFSMNDNDINPREDVVVGTYDANGVLVFDKDLDRSYSFHLSPSPQETRVQFEPILNNLSADLVEYSSTGGVLQPGEADMTVSVNFIDKTYAFAKESLNEQTYEVGVKATVDGYKIASGTFESKLVIRKEAYKAYAVLGDKPNNKISFGRTYFDGELMYDPEPISHTFKIVLDKPAIHDIRFDLVTSGVDEQVLDDVSIEMPEGVTISAGQKESAEITWSVTNDFLLADENKGIWNFEVTPIIQGEDERVRIDENSKLTITVVKVTPNLSVVTEKPSGWTSIDKTGWEIADAENVDSPECLIDGTPDYAISYGAPMNFLLNMSTSKSLKGLSIKYSEGKAQDITIATSEDKKTWTTQGTLIDLPRNNEQIFLFKEEVKAQYVKVDITKIQDSWFMFSIEEIYFYE